MLTHTIVQLVDLSRRHALTVIALCVLAAVSCGWYAANHFKMNTDVNQLLSADLEWRKQEAVLEKAFPQNVDTTVVVIDGDTPDAAENAAAALTEKLRTMPDKFSSVERPDSIPFFRKNGLLYLEPEKLAGILEQLVQAQPMLGMLASDPSLRGLLNMIGLMLQGLQHGQTDYSRLDQPLTKIAETIEDALAGQDRPLAFQSMAAGDETPSLRDLQKFIMTKPVLDYTALEPGHAANNALRAAAQALNLTPENGVRVRLTGSVPLNDEEFASVAEGTGLATILSGVLVFLLLLWALRSLRLVLPILLTLTVGLVITSAFALFAVGSLNLISVAFAVMFIGIAVDFGIQFGVRYRDQHHQDPEHGRAMQRTAAVIAIPLAMAAGSTALGFLAFIPTDYRGVSELGLIAGAGMLIAFVLNITLLPALLTLAQPPAEKEAIGYRWAAPLDVFLIKQRRAILAVSIALALLGAGIMTQLRFDFDPLHLKDPQTESVSTLLDVMKDPDSGFYKIGMLRPSSQEAQDLAATLEKLPEVDHVMTLASFVPDGQDAKLAMIADTRMLLEPTLNLPATQKPPTDQEIFDSIRKTSAALKAVASQHPSAVRLAKALDDVLAKNDPALLPRLQKNLIGVMQSKLEMVKQTLSAERVTVENITEDLRRDWVTPDGRWLVQAYPKGSPPEHDALVAFTKAVRQVAPDAAGTPISIQESGHTVTSAFMYAGIYALAAIGLLALLILRRTSDVLRLLAPLILAGILTLATIVVIGLPLNFANIIALPLLLSLGVSYAIYFISYWRAGMNNPLQSSMARAVLFSAATVLVAFGSLALSTHPGTSGMGKLLTVALLYSLICTFFVLPALLGPSKTDKD
ncbi:MAG: MMPL family transporter [Alphaproteobacteria bacterium]|nr:MMPL family transporter [Alphaproteobacteria bacterium]